LRALEQWGAKFTLQRLNRHRQRRLSDVQPPRCPSEVQFFRQYNELSPRTKISH
jgi:hypothetical protein